MQRHTSSKEQQKKQEKQSPVSQAVVKAQSQATMPNKQQEPRAIATTEQNAPKVQHAAGQLPHESRTKTTLEQPPNNPSKRAATGAVRATPSPVAKHQRVDADSGGATSSDDGLYRQITTEDMVDTAFPPSASKATSARASGSIKGMPLHTAPANTTSSPLVIYLGTSMISRDVLENYLFHEKISVYKISLQHKVEAVVIKTDLLQKPLTRIAFLEKSLVWFAEAIINGGQTSKWPTTITRSRLEAALTLLGGLDAEKVLETYKSYIFSNTRRSGDVISFYAKDGKLSSSSCARSIFKKVFESNDVLHTVWREDVLPAIGNPDGMTWNTAWVYTGGPALAGYHVEDSSLHFMHTMLDIDCEGPDAHDMCGIGEREWLRAMRVLNLVKQMSQKSWLCGRTTDAVDGLLSVASMLSEESEVCDGNSSTSLSRRAYLPNPAYMCTKYGDIFYECIMKPGDCMLARESHSVIGYTGLSIAWNVCFNHFIPDYLKMEKHLCDAVDTNAVLDAFLRRRKYETRGDAIRYSLSCELSKAADTVFDTFMNGFSIVKHTNQQSMTRLWNTVLKPSRELLWHIYKHQTSAFEGVQSGQPSILTQENTVGVAIVCVACGIHLLFKAAYAHRPCTIKGQTSNVDAVLQPFCDSCVHALGEVWVRCSKAPVVITIRSDLDIFWREYAAV